MTLTQDILERALALGFDSVGILPVGAPRHAATFAEWLAVGYHGEMAYLAARAAERTDPAMYAPGAKSMILLAASYVMDDADSGITRGAQGRIARYACWPDYHDAIKPKLYALDAFIRARTGRETLGKVFVDTAPVLERDFVAQAGLGFIGRNCCLITPGLGSWTFLAGLMVPERLTVHDGPWTISQQTIDYRPSSIVRGCGRCTRCLDACPTRAFVAPNVLDARRCISYLTIELRGPIPRELRPLMGDWVFGCDVCQEVCPYNRQAGAKQVDAGQGCLSARVDRAPFVAASVQRRISLSELLTLDDAGFRALFRGTPVLRARRRGLVRNACVAAGNSGDATLVPLLAGLLADAEPLVRGHAAWALGRLGGAAARRALELSSTTEVDPWVREELTRSTSALTSTLSS